MAGDLNATLRHRALRRALGPSTSVAAALGRGSATTWPTSLPRWLGVTIDHVVAGRDVGARHVEILDLPGTDHRAVLAGLVLP